MRFILTILICVLHVHKAVCQEPSEGLVEFYTEDYLEPSQSDIPELQTSEMWEIVETPLFSEEPYLMTEFPESLFEMGPSSVMVEPSDSLTEIIASSVVDWEVLTSGLVEPTTVKPECFDREERCDELGLTVCSDYVEWARYYCADFCDLCDQMVATPPGDIPTITAQTDTTSEASPTTPAPTTTTSDVSPTTPAPTTLTEAEMMTTEEPCCVDQLGWEQCLNYRLESCQEPYRAWASQRCQAFCGMCKPCPIEPCEDAIELCERFGEESCTAQSYRKWALQNCRKHCGLCSNYGFYNILHNVTVPESTVTPAPPTTAATTTSTSENRPVSKSTPPLVVCQDAVSHCAEYQREDCANYSGFMSVYCPRYCGFCSDGDSTSTPQAAVHTQASTSSQSGSTETGSPQPVRPSSTTSSSTTEIPLNCGDVFDNCTSSYSQDICCGLYEPWARAHCASFCGFCGKVPERLCEDTVDYCQQEPDDLCSNHIYYAWVLDNCAGFCKLCENDPWQPASCAAHLFQPNTQGETDDNLVG